MKKFFLKAISYPSTGSGSRARSRDKLKATSGFTLVEVIIYIGIIASVLAFSFLAFFQLFASANANRGRLAVEGESTFVVQKIGWALHGGESLGEPTGGGTSTRLRIARFNFSENPVFFEFASGGIWASRASGTLFRLTSDRVIVTNFLVTHIPAVINRPEGVRFTLALKFSSTDEAVSQASTTLTTTIYLRK